MEFQPRVGAIDGDRHGNILQHVGIGGYMAGKLFLYVLKLGDVERVADQAELLGRNFGELVQAAMTADDDVAAFRLRTARRLRTRRELATGAAFKFLQLGGPGRLVVGIALDRLDIGAVELGERKILAAPPYRGRQGVEHRFQAVALNFRGCQLDRGIRVQGGLAGDVRNPDNIDIGMTRAAPVETDGMAGIDGQQGRGEFLATRAQSVDQCAEFLVVAIAELLRKAGEAGRPGIAAGNPENGRQTVGNVLAAIGQPGDIGARNRGQRRSTDRKIAFQPSEMPGRYKPTPAKQQRRRPEKCDQRVGNGQFNGQRRFAPGTVSCGEIAANRPPRLGNR